MDGVIEDVVADHGVQDQDVAVCVSDDGCVLGVGLGAARRQVGDPSHGSLGQVVCSGAHVLRGRHGQGPDGGGLIDHHQQAP